jgi:TrmH family RNA methyltransferase
VSLAALILVETGQAGNLGAAMRVAANFGVSRVELVRPDVDPASPEVLNWACGAEAHLECRTHESFTAATAVYRTVAGTASARGRDNLPVLGPREAIPRLVARGLDRTALVFGNETSGLNREDLDRCDLVIRVPTEPSFPVLNLAQAIAILTAELKFADQEEPLRAPDPAPQDEVDALMDHLHDSLLNIGFLDPQSPQRILRKLRRLFGRGGITSNEVQILRGICRQMNWAAGAKPGRFDQFDPDRPASGPGKGDRVKE